MLHCTPRRRGAALVEFALVAPILLLFLIGLVVGGITVFRYQEVASLSREAARYASVRGDKYQRATGNPAATPEDIYNNVIRPGAISLDPSKIDYSVTWDPDKRQGSRVSVRISYHLLPEFLLGGITLSSTSTIEMSY